MIEPVSLSTLLTSDPLAATHAAIVETLKPLLPGVSVTLHPGKVDLSELVARKVVVAPGIGIGWSRIRPTPLSDGSYSCTVEWVAYIAAEAKAVANRRVEKEAVGLAIGAQLLRILSDLETTLWGRPNVMPVPGSSIPELKPIFTVKDAEQGTAYYAVTWSQEIIDIGDSVFPDHVGRFNEETGLIDYDQAQQIEEISPWIPAREVADDA